MTQRGDVWRIRRSGSKDAWCICSVDIVSPNGESVGLLVVDGALHPAPGGMMFGAIMVSIDAQKGIATEVFTQTELEIDERIESIYDA